MKTRNIIALIVVVSVLLFIGIGIWKDKVTWETAMATLAPTLSLVYFLNGWNKTEIELNQMENRFKNYINNQN